MIIIILLSNTNLIEIVKKKKQRVWRDSNIDKNKNKNKNNYKNENKMK